MKRGKLGLLVISVAALALAVGAGTGLAGSGTVTDGPATVAGTDTGSAIVQLNGDPLSTYVKTKPPQGKKIDFSSDAVKAYRARLSALRNDFKQWLQANAPKAKITGQYDISLNAVAVQLNGTPLSAIASAPQVKTAQYEGLYTPQAIVDPDLTLIDAFTAWGGSGQGANAGKIAGAGNARVKIGILDTGIDVTQPCFNDAGFPATTKQGPPSLTNNKVIVAKVFNNKTPSRNYTPLAVQAHGTHVAGSAACDYGVTNATTTVDGVTVGYGVQGVAPAAQLGNYNIFPGDVLNARSEDILNALEAAYQDGMDVVNMSLGGKSSGIQDLLTNAIDDLDQAGMISAVAAGNAGPGLSSVESPGSAARALTAGAVTVGHFIGAPVTNGANTYGAQVGDFATASSNITANLNKVGGGTGTACTALAAGSLTGQIALISRGACTFTTKVRNAQNAGAVAVLIRNNQFGGPIAMGQDGTAPVPTIPAYMVSKADGDALIASAIASTTIGATLQYFQNTANSNFLSSFSGRGPTDVDFRVKPDVTAPGENVLSSIPGTGPESCTPAFPAPCWAFFQGTSMATPHLAGSAAVVLGQHPGWASWQVRSAIVNTADQNVTDSATGTLVTNVNFVGSGRENLASAVSAKVALDPVSVSFGAVPSGSGRSDSRTVTLSTLSGSGPYTVAVTNQTGGGVSFGATISGSTITATMTASKGIPAGGRQGIVRISAGGTEIAHAAVYALIK